RYQVSVHYLRVDSARVRRAYSWRCCRSRQEEMTGTIELIGQPLFNGYYYFTSGYCPLDESMYCFGGPPGAPVTRIQLLPSVDEDVVTGITGDTGFLNQSAPGVAWHPGRQRFVIWIGGKDPYLFDPAWRTVKRETLGGDNLAIRRLNGTYGRF